MKIKEFKYHKDTEVKDYKVVILKESEPNQSFFEGISIKDLSEEDQQKVIEIFKDFEAKLQPYMKQYRRFNNDKVVK